MTGSPVHVHFAAAHPQLTVSLTHARKYLPLPCAYPYHVPAMCLPTPCATTMCLPTPCATTMCLPIPCATNTCLHDGEKVHLRTDTLIGTHFMVAICCLQHQPQQHVVKTGRDAQITALHVTQSTLATCCCQNALQCHMLTHIKGSCAWNNQTGTAALNSTVSVMQ